MVQAIGAALSGTRLSLRVEGIRLDEALVRRQVRGRSLWSAGPRIAQARHVLEQARFRYVEWIGSGGPDGPSSAPPLRMRLRCWYEVVIETGAGKRVVLREEGLRGDDARTAARAIGRWRTRHAQPANALVVVRGIRIAKRQPRPMPPVETHVDADGAIPRRRGSD